MKIIVTGATGMVGSEVIRQAIADEEIVEITAVVRKPLDVEHPKLKTVVHKNFLDYSSLTSVFANADACIWCLGISQNQVSKEEYIKITYDFTLAAAKKIVEINPFMTFLFLSGDGAATNEKSLFLFGRIKGKTENALMQLAFKKLFIARPGAILPIEKNSYSSLINWQYKIVKLIKYFVPSFVITSTELAIALLSIAKKGANKIILAHKDLKQIALNASNK